MRRLDGMLYLIRANPTLLDPVPPTDGEKGEERLMQRRVLGEMHMCLACGGDAHAALIADTPDGRRWLDVCWEDYVELSKPDEEMPYERP